MNDEVLFVLKFFTILGMELSLYRMLDATIRLFIAVFSAPNYRSRQVSRKVKLEWYGVVSWAQRRIEGEAGRTVLHKCIVVSAVYINIIGFSICLTVPFRIGSCSLSSPRFSLPVTDIFFAFYPNVEVSSLEKSTRFNSDVDLTENLVSRIVEGLVSFDI